MLLDLSRALKEPGQAFPFEVSIAIEPMEVLDDPVSFESVTLSGEMTGSGESVSIDATASATIHTRCARCLADVMFPAKAHVEEVFTREPNPDDPDHYLMDGKTVLIDPVIQDALLLSLPMRFLCKDDCLGLCPTCGKDRNTERCTCQRSDENEDKPRVQHPFAALSELFEENEEV